MLENCFLFLYSLTVRNDENHNSNNDDRRTSSNIEP